MIENVFIYRAKAMTSNRICVTGAEARVQGKSPANLSSKSRNLPYILHVIGQASSEYRSMHETQLKGHKTDKRRIIDYMPT